MSNTTASNTTASNANTNLSSDQLKMIQRGLRFVKRSISLDMHDPSEGSPEKRHREISEVEQLAKLIESFVPSQSAVNA